MPARAPRLRRFVSHPVTALLVAVLCIGALAVAATADANRSARMPIRVTHAECYHMAYVDPVAGASADYFPARIVLLPGTDSGAVQLEGTNGRAIWWTFGKASTWRAVGRDSIALELTNGRAFIDVRASRAGGHLSGRATYRANLAAPVSPPSMRFVGDLGP